MISGITIESRSRVFEKSRGKLFGYLSLLVIHALHDVFSLRLVWTRMSVYMHVFSLDLNLDINILVLERWDVRLKM